jgi:hypothetical protein
MHVRLDSMVTSVPQVLRDVDGIADSVNDAGFSRPHLM